MKSSFRGFCVKFGNLGNRKIGIRQLLTNNFEVQLTFDQLQTTNFEVQLTFDQLFFGPL